LIFVPHRHSKIMFEFCCIYITRSTGSGKTTTLYSLVLHCSVALNRNVITLEDPVEKLHEEMVQIQVNEKAGITYSAGLKAILRHDPDIIMVGEIRDRETAEIAVRAALTGHPVILIEPCNYSMFKYLYTTLNYLRLKSRSIEQ
jgi:Tfp pilus assembly pilus retraction ATPase PilT